MLTNHNMKTPNLQTLNTGQGIPVIQISHYYQ